MAETKPPLAPQFNRQLLPQLLAERQTAGEIEDLLKDPHKALIEHALQGELTHHVGDEEHAAA
jgi:transposase-like protein